MQNHKPGRAEGKAHSSKFGDRYSIRSHPEVCLRHCLRVTLHDTLLIKRQMPLESLEESSV